MSSSGYPIYQILKNSDTQLGKLIAQARSIEEINQTFSKVLDTDLISHCRVGCYQSGVLTLFSDSAAYATRIRYQIPQLLSHLRSFEQWAGLCSIQIKVQVFKPAIESKCETFSLPPPALIPSSCIKQLRSLADSLKDDPNAQNLVKSLERLAKHQK